MTAPLTVYAFTFMRYALVVTSENYLLFACHMTNAAAQMTPRLPIIAISPSGAGGQGEDGGPVRLCQLL